MSIDDKIFLYLQNSKVISDAINNIVDDKKWIDDFKQHFLLQLLEMDRDKLRRAYLQGYLDFLCIRIILNQWRSKNSSFYYQYKHPNWSQNKELNGTIVDISEKTIDFDYKMAEDILMVKPEKWLDKQYHVTLFKLYYEEGLNYREISELTNININSIAQSIRGSIKYIKKKYKII